MQPPKPVAAISLAELASAEAADALDRARAVGPVVWVPELGGWLVTSRRAATVVLRDSETFTVDDPRFSTAVVVGQSMLSTDGAAHARHRDPFASMFASSAVAALRARVEHIADARVQQLAPTGAADLRAELAGVVAVDVIADVLGLDEVDPTTVLDWYGAIVEGVNDVSDRKRVSEQTEAALAELRAAVDGAGPASPLARLGSELDGDDLFANVAVLMFGAIETNEAMTANALWYMLSNPTLYEEVRRDPSRVGDLIEESLRLEPAAAVVDRYATADVEVDGACIEAGDFVRVSLQGANRDPAVFDDAATFALDRHNARQHLAFVQGPHVCLGLHLARSQTAAILNSVLRSLDQLRLVDAEPPTGLIFRKPERLVCAWDR